MKIQALLAMVALCCFAAGCPGNSSFSPPPKDYQIATCKDLSPTVNYVKSTDALSITSLNTTPVAIADNQVTIQNGYYTTIPGSMSEGSSEAADKSYQTVLKWNQNGEDVEFRISLSCLEKNPSDPSPCFSLAAGKLDKRTATYEPSATLGLTMDLRFTTPQGQPSQMKGKLLYATLSGKIDLTEVSCQAHCETTKAGISLGLWETVVDEGANDNRAHRDCNYTCDNAAIGSVKTKCSTDACTGEDAALSNATSGIPKDLSCTTVSSDFSALPPLTVTLTPSN